MNKENDSKYTEEYYTMLIDVKKRCAVKMRSKSHDEQLEKFVDTLHREGLSESDIIKGMVYAYNISRGYATNLVSNYLKTISTEVKEVVNG